MSCDASAENVHRFKLGNARTFHYLNQSNCYELEGVDDSKEYIATRKAMDIDGISSDEQEGIFRVVAAILHLETLNSKRERKQTHLNPKMKNLVSI